MSRKNRHFATLGDRYPRIVRALMPYREELLKTSTFPLELTRIIAKECWSSGLLDKKLKALQKFINRDKLHIAAHIEELIKDDSASITHRSAKIKEIYLRKLALALKYYKAELSSKHVLSIKVLKIVASQYFKVANPNDKQCEEVKSMIYSNKDILIGMVVELNVDSDLMI